MSTFNQARSMYSREQVSMNMTDLGMTTKRASTEAYQDFEAHDILKCRQFWTLGGPLGVIRVSRRRLLDIDEFGVALQKKTPYMLPHQFGLETLVITTTEIEAYLLVRHRTWGGSG